MGLRSLSIVKANLKSRIRDLECGCLKHSEECIERRKERKEKKMERKIKNKEACDNLFKYVFYFSSIAMILLILFCVIFKEEWNHE